MLDESATENFTKLGELNGAKKSAEINDCSSHVLNNLRELTPKITSQGLHLLKIYLNSG